MCSFRKMFTKGLVEDLANLSRTILLLHPSAGFSPMSELMSPPRGARTLLIPFAFVVCCLLDLVAKLFCSWASENLGTCSADVEGVRVPESVSR